MRGGWRGELHCRPPSSKNMRTTKKGPAIRPTSLHYMAGIFALALACCSLLCIYWYTTSAHASSGFQQAKGMAISGLVKFDDTETETPSSTTTITPSPTTSTTSTPTPSPSATRTTTPSPTSTKAATPTATGRPTPTATGLQTPSPGARPTSSATSISITTQGTGVNQTPVASPAPTNTRGDQASQGTPHPGNTLPLSSLTLSLGSVILLGLLCILGWVSLRRRLLPLSSPRLPPSGAAPWSRTRASEQVSPFTSQDTQPAPSSKDHATTTAASRTSHTSPPVNRGQSFDSPYLAARIRQRRAELRAAASLSAFQRRGPDELSAELTESSDPYLQSLIQLYSERGQAARQAPHGWS